MKRYHTFSLLIVIALLATMISGCGTTDSSAAVSSEATVSESVAEPSPTAEEPTPETEASVVEDSTLEDSSMEAQEETPVKRESLEYPLCEPGGAGIQRVYLCRRPWWHGGNPGRISCLSDC